ncbi:hypothetical protein [Maribacter aquivivus]|uniref:hypothetical protein n=1 Tax=Maribacter aquivivus TaxID=228958 RepID=UPI0024928512|nr:hypothetical protein [Maribacter aquivivus]
MTRKEITKILKTESGIILVQKESEQLFFESILNNSNSVFAPIYFLASKKLDYLILTKKRILLIVRNKLEFEKNLNGSESLVYNGIKSSLEITDFNKKSIIRLNKLRINFDEGNLIKQKLIEFKN